MFEFPFDETNPITNEAYNLSNYKIIDNPDAINKNTCCLLFSSNGLFWNGKSNTPENQKNKIIENDYYEWQNTLIKSQPGRIIYFRDIFLSWYILGINEEVNSVSKLIELIKDLTIGYTHIFAGGVSSGGYIASIIASELNIDTCFIFSGQFSLNHHNNKNPILNYYKNDNDRNYYYENQELIKNNQINGKNKTKFVYFYPTLVGHDCISCKYSKEINNIYRFPIKYNKHGVIIDKKSLIKVLSWNDVEIIKYYKKWESKSKKQFKGRFSFCNMLNGPIYTSIIFIKLALDKVKRTVFKH